MFRSCPLAALLVVLSACSSTENRARDFRDCVALGESRMREGDAPGAARAYERATDIEPTSASTWLRLGEARREAGDETGASEAFRRAFELNLDDATLWFHRGKELQEAGDHTGAVADYTKALAIRTEPEFQRARGHARFCIGDLDGAIADLDEAAGRQHSGGAHEFTLLELAAVRLRAGKRAEAIVGLKKHLDQTHAKVDTAWPRQIAEFLLGDLTESELLLTARTGDAKTRRERTCEAAFYAGIARAANDDADGALPLFRECSENAVPGFVEPPMARAEISRLQRGR